MREEEGLGANGDAARGERLVGRVRLLVVVMARARPPWPGSTLLCGAWRWSRSNLFAGSLSLSVLLFLDKMARPHFGARNRFAAFPPAPQVSQARRLSCTEPGSVL